MTSPHHPGLVTIVALWLTTSGSAVAGEATCLPGCPEPLTCQPGGVCIDLAAEAISLKTWQAEQPPSREEALLARQGLHFGLSLEGGGYFGTTNRSALGGNWKAAFLANWATGPLDLRAQLSLLWNINSLTIGWAPNLRLGVGLQLADRVRMSVAAILGATFDFLFVNGAPILGVELQPLVLALGANRSVELGLVGEVFEVTSWRFTRNSEGNTIEKCRSSTGSVTCEVVRPMAFFGVALRLSFLFL